MTDPRDTLPDSNTAVAELRVLLLEIDANRANAIERSLTAAQAGDLQIEQFNRLDAALARMETVTFDAVLTRSQTAGELGPDLVACIRAVEPDTLILPLPEAGGSADGDHPVDTTWLADALRYVVRRKQAEAVLQLADEALFEEKERARVTLRSIGDAVLVTDSAGNVTYLNPVAEELTGWRSVDACGRPLTEVFAIIDGETRETATNPAQKAMASDQVVGLDANCVLRGRDGTESGIEDSAAPIHDRHRRVSGAVIVFRDVSQSRAMTRKMAYLAQHDVLTGLANRTLFRDRLDQTISLARRHGRQVGVLFVDLDDFKRINDDIGHASGDRLLQEAARLLTTCVRATDTVCRYGGDEFVILLPEIEHPEDASQVAAKLIAAFDAPLDIGDRDYRLSLSIGISVFPDDGNSIESILEQADHRMYQAKADNHSTNSVVATGSSARPASPVHHGQRLAPVTDKG